jgi:ABC-type amino acid transport substrate-binding protein
VRRWWWLAALLVLVVAAGGWLWWNRGQGLPFFPARDWAWQAIQSRGSWRIGLDPSFPPFEQLDEMGKPVGYDVELARHIAAEWGKEVVIVPIGFDSLLDAVRTAQVESVVSAYPFDPRLTRDVRFSTSYFEAGVFAAVRNDSPIQAISELADQTIAVEWGSIGDMVGRRLQHATPTIHLAQFATPDEAVQALVDDPQIDAVLVDNVTLRQAQARGLPLRALQPVLESNPYVIVMPQSARTLQEAVDKALQTLRESGVLDELERTWFATDP